MDTLEVINNIEEKLCYKATLTNIPLSGAFELLPLCNMNCSMCYIRLTSEEMNKIGHIRTADEWLSIAKEMKDAGTLFILLTGGEPLLYKEFEKIYNGLREMGMIVTINTNGTLINDKVCNMLANNKPRRVNVTLYGASNETYEKLCHNPKGYDETIRGINLLKQKNIDIKLNVSLVKENINDLPKMLEIANSLEVPIKVDTYMYPKTKGIKNDFNNDDRIDPQKVANIDTFIRYNTETEESFMKNRWEYLNRYEYGKNTKPAKSLPLSCRAGKSSFWINWQGNMTPCVFLDNIYMDVFENSFIKSWNYIVEESKKILLSSDCKHCDKREVCQVCAAAAYCETGSVSKKPEYLCKLTEETIKILNC